jgi:DNA-directed RNA polymerase subunit beta
LGDCVQSKHQGQTAGIVNSPALLRRFGRNGCLKALVNVRQNGWFQLTPKNNILKPSSSTWISQKKGDCVTRLATGLLSNFLGKIQLKNSPMRFDVEFEKIFTAHQNQIELVNIGPENILALGPNLIPFFENDDGNRVLIGANIIRQALTTLKVSVPRVSSGLETIVRNESGQNLRARWSGFVCYVSSNRILVQSKISGGSTVRHHRWKQFHFQQNSKLPFHRIENQLYSCCIEYRLGGVFRSNQSNWQFQRPYVKEGIWVQSGDLLADGRASLHGQLAVGQNLLLGYIPWDGLNFEDAMVANYDLATKELFTSVHVEEWEVSLRKTPYGTEIFVPFSWALIDRVEGRHKKFRVDSYFAKKISYSFSKKKNVSLMLEQKNFVFPTKKRNFKLKDRETLPSFSLTKKLRIKKVKK